MVINTQSDLGEKMRRRRALIFIFESFMVCCGRDGRRCYQYSRIATREAEWAKKEAECIANWGDYVMSILNPPHTRCMFPFRFRCNSVGC